MIAQAEQALHDGKSKEILWSIHMLYTISDNSIVEHCCFIFSEIKAFL